MSPPVDQAAAKIHNLVSDQGFLGHDRNDHLHQINDTLKALPPQEVDQVLSKLSSDDLKSWAGNVNSGGILGMQGLSGTEKKDLFNMFARDLDGGQLARVSNAFGDRGDVLSLGQSVAQLATPTAKVQYIQQLAGQTTTGESSHIDNGILSQTTTLGDQEASAVGNVLASLKGNPQAVTDALNALSGPQLQAVMTAAENQKLTSYTFGGGVAPSITTDAKPLQDILSAAATSKDPAAKARVFEAGTKALGDIQGTSSPLTPNLGAGDDARRVTQGLTAILNSDTTGVVRALKQDEPSGKSLSNYMKEMFTEDPSAKNKTISTMVARLQQGNDLNQNPLDFVDKAVDDGHGGQVYINAENLGYFSGAMQAGINSKISDADAQGDALNNIFSNALSAGTGWASVPVQVGGSVASAGISQMISEVTDDVKDGEKDLQDALFQLSVPHLPDGKAAELAADSSFNSTRDTVILQNQ